MAGEGVTLGCLDVVAHELGTHGGDALDKGSILGRVARCLLIVVERFIKTPLGEFFVCELGEFLRRFGIGTRAIWSCASLGAVCGGADCACEEDCAGD